MIKRKEKGNLKNIMMKNDALFYFYNKSKKKITRKKVRNKS
jgi:hypothetical protein